MKHTLANRSIQDRRHPVVSSAPRQRKSDRNYRLIDLFSGAGCFTLGFTAEFGHSFASVWANDIDSSAAESYEANFGHCCVPGDIVDILDDPITLIPSADIVIGGPPCQGFSLLNKNREGDPRKQLWRPFFDVVRRSKADVFVMENVPQLLGSFEHGEILGLAEALGFKVQSEKLLAADYGVPQIRYRAFIVGCKFCDPKEVFPPPKTHFNPRNGKSLRLNFVGEPLKEWRTVRDAIQDLPAPIGTEIRQQRPPLNLHFGRTPTAISLERYRAIPDEGMNRFDLQRRREDLTPPCWIRKTSGGTDLFGRLWWDRPAFTIRTEFFKPEKGRYLHPVENRPITHREAARIQSIPDSFQFRGSKTEVARQIGNAVPPLLAARVADCVVALLERRIGGKQSRRRALVI
jgi:DNA (cytosine-5)-methyltransferase 1